MKYEDKPVIFLDFDGVIRNRGWMRDAILRINTLIYRTAGRVVITSDWRHSHSLPELKNLLFDRGLQRIKEVDQTDILPHSGEIELVAWHDPRYTEIWNYVRKHDVKKFVVIDDMIPLKDTDLAPYLVLTNYDAGFTETDMERAIHIIKSPPVVTATYGGSKVFQQKQEETKAMQEAMSPIVAEAPKRSRSRKTKEVACSCPSGGSGSGNRCRDCGGIE